MATGVMAYRITFGDLRLKGLSSVTINSSVEILADTATITLPSMIHGLPYDLEAKIKRGSKVRIDLGYNDYFVKEFEGFVRSISLNNPSKIECEDQMYLFRKEIKPTVFVKKNVNDILTYVCGQIGGFSYKSNPELSGMIYDKFTVQSATGYEVLQSLKEQFLINIYIEKNVLRAGLKYTERLGTVTLDFTKNIQAESLDFLQSTDVKVQVKIKGQGKDNKVSADVQVGTAGGVVRQLPNRLNITDRATLEKIAKEELKRLSYSGYRGDLTTWGVPFVQRGYNAKIIDKDYPAREGVYFVKSVNTDFSIAGFRRKIELGERL